MNVNSRGHNLDKRFKQLFLEIKHPPWVKIPWEEENQLSSGFSPLEPSRYPRANASMQGSPLSPSEPL